MQTKAKKARLQVGPLLAHSGREAYPFPIWSLRVTGYADCTGGSFVCAGESAAWPPCRRPRIQRHLPRPAPIPNQRRTFDLSKLTKTPIIVTSAAVDMIVNRLGPYQWLKTRGVVLVSSKLVSP